MNITTDLLAKLDYPSPAVMLVSMTIMIAFIWGGGTWLKRLDEQSKAKRAAFLAKIAAENKTTNP
jgi:hypothetical protein